MYYFKIYSYNYFATGLAMHCFVKGEFDPTFFLTTKKTIYSQRDYYKNYKGQFLRVYL